MAEEELGSVNDSTHPLFERDVNITLDTTQATPNPGDDHVSKLNSEEISVTTPFTDIIETEVKFTSHPICMRVENSKIKMVDLTQMLINYRKIPMAPDGFIPNSEIRLLLNKPFEDCIPPKPLPPILAKKDTKTVLDEILLKYLPEDLVFEPPAQLQTVQDMALLAESKNARNKAALTLEDNEELNKDLVDQIEGEDEMEGMIQNISMRTSKSKRKKYARQITKAAMMNQLEKKIKEKEEKRKEQLKQDEERLMTEKEEELRRINLETQKSGEIVDIDILETLDRNLNDDLSREMLIAKRKENEQKKLQQAVNKVNTGDLMNLLFDTYGEEATYKMIYGALKNDPACIANIDSVVKTRQNRLLVLNTVTNTPFAFPYVAANLDGKDKLVKIAVMMDDASSVDKDILANLQGQVSDIMGDETKMVQFLSKLNSSVICAKDKLKPLTDKPYDIIVNAFDKKEDALNILKNCFGSDDKRDKFLNLIEACEEVAIEKFALSLKERGKKSIAGSKKEKKKSIPKADFEPDFYGSLSEEQRKLLPALPGTGEMTETPSELAGRIAKALQLKKRKELEPSEGTERTSLASSVMDPKFKTSQFTRTGSEKIIGEAEHGAPQARPTHKRKQKHPESGAKSDYIEEEHEGDRIDLAKSLKVTGHPKTSDEIPTARKRSSSQTPLKASDLLSNYYERLTNQSWWPSDMTVELNSNSIIMALVKLLYNAAKLTNHSDICQFIIEFKRMFPISKDARNDSINLLYEYFKQDREGAIRAKSERNAPSHIFYCKRVLNVLSVLKSLDEDIEEFREDFLNKYGEIEGMSKVTRDRSLKMDSDVPEDKLKHTFETHKASSDSRERVSKTPEKGAVRETGIETIQESAKERRKEGTKESIKVLEKEAGRETPKDRGKDRDTAELREKLKQADATRKSKSEIRERLSKKKDIDEAEAKERAAKLIETLKTTTDAKERNVISEAIQSLIKSEAFPVSIKQNMISETNAYFSEVKEKLQKALGRDKNEAEQEQLYQQLVQASEILNNVVLDDRAQQGEEKVEESTRKSSIKIPNFKEIKSNPKLLSQAKPLSDVQIKKIAKYGKKESVGKGHKIEKTEKVGRFEKHEKFEADEHSERLGKLKKDDLSQGAEVQVKTVEGPSFEGVIKGKKILEREKYKELKKKEKGYEKDKDFPKQEPGSEEISFDSRDADKIFKFDSEKSKPSLRSSELDQDGNLIDDTPENRKRLTEKKLEKEKRMYEKITPDRVESKEDIKKTGKDLESPRKDTEKETTVEETSPSILPTAIEKDKQTRKITPQSIDGITEPEKEMLIKDEEAIPIDFTRESFIQDRDEMIAKMKETEKDKFKVKDRDKDREKDKDKEKEKTKAGRTGRLSLEPRKSLSMGHDKVYTKVSDEKVDERESAATQKSPDKLSKTADDENKSEVTTMRFSPQSLIRDLFTTLEAKLNTEKIESIDPQLISKILAEQLIASQIDPEQLGNISREMIQSFFEKVPMLEKTKQGLEEILIDNIENLVVKFNEHRDVNIDKKSDLIGKLQDVSSILKSITVDTDATDQGFKDDEESSKLDFTSAPQRQEFLQPVTVVSEAEAKAKLAKLQQEENKNQIRQNIVQHLQKYLVKSKVDLSNPVGVVEDLIKQKDATLNDTDRMIQISQALYSISQDPLVNNTELMEIIASSSFSDLITEMQNILSHSLKQYDIPPNLIKSTSNFLLLQDIGIKELEDFQEELKKFAPMYPKEVDFSSNPLSQFKDGEYKLNISKHDVVIDKKLNFMRDVSNLKPMDKEKGIEMGLLVKTLYSDDDFDEVLTGAAKAARDREKPQFPVMFDLSKTDTKKMLREYTKKEDLLRNMAEMENVVKVHDRKIDMGMRIKRDSLDSIIEMARDQKPGSKTRLLRLISKSPVLQALVSIGSSIDISSIPDVRKTSKSRKLRERFHSLPSSPRHPSRLSLTSPDRGKKYDHFGSIYGKATDPNGINVIQLLSDEEVKIPPKDKILKKKRKLPKLTKSDRQLKYRDGTEMKIHTKVERKLTTYGLPNIADLVSKKVEFYGSIDALRSRIKEEISNEYSDFSKKIDFDSLIDQTPETSAISEKDLAQAKRFQRFYGKHTTLLPFIGQSKSLVGKVLDQGLRALHFNLGPGILVKAIMESEKIGSSSDIKVSQEEWWQESSKHIENVLEMSHESHSEPKKYLTNKQLMHCRMTSRPCSIPAQEWAKIAVSGTRKNLRPELFSTYHKTQHCAYQVLAHKHLHRHGISISKHLERYETLEIVNKSLQENAYIRIQNSLLKCLLRVLEDK